MHIVAIGGGELQPEGRNKGTLAIDRYIVGLSGKETPRALFVPTASGDDESYCRSFAEIYGNKLGCRTESLLLSTADTEEDLRQKISEADLIYVGGGYTARMLKIWRSCGLDSLLEAAHHNGTVLAGISAGAICWHDWGHSNSYASSSTGRAGYRLVKGLGLRRGTFCPHLDEEQRHDSFVELVRRRGGLGIACDNGAAVHYAPNAEARVVSAHDQAGVVIYRREGDEVVRERFGDRELVNLPEQ